MGKMKPSKENQIEFVVSEIVKELERWEYLRKYGACDPFWPDDVKCDDMKDGTAAFSLYEEWVIEPDLQFKSKLAAQIRDLPVRDGVECE